MGAGSLLATHPRQDSHRVGNGRFTPLLDILRSQTLN